ncbi:DNA-binding anti-repressor SinI [Salibacterium salarium]|uniref:DNA-binding anti-repressor SinI n=1 Tax=Salibacterium salarium TaxID=284579 RepID=A0A3R9WS95_9BACI|nr:DNA-binding anti-repressor SinI [Salibacterium salarium]
MNMLVPIKLDQEWVDLIKEAKEAGLTLEEVKEFFDREDLDTNR